MKQLLLLTFISISFAAKAQKIDSIYVNLYTDSLKKGTYNYINVDGLMSNGKYTPLDSAKVSFFCDQASFVGNSLVIPGDFKEPKASVKVQLKSNPLVYKTFEIYVKTQEDPPLKTEAEILAELKANRKNKKAANN